MADERYRGECEPRPTVVASREQTGPSYLGNQAALGSDRRIAIGRSCERSARFGAEPDWPGGSIPHGGGLPLSTRARASAARFDRFPMQVKLSLVELELGLPAGRFVRGECQ